MNDLEHFASNYGEVASKDLKDKKEVVVYKDSNRHVFLNVKNDKATDK